MPTWAVILLSIYGGVGALVFVVAWWFMSVFVGNADAPRGLSWRECGEAIGMAAVIAVAWPLMALGALVKAVSP